MIITIWRNRSVIIQEFIRGVRLSQIIKHSGSVQPEKVIEVGIALCNAVEPLHEHSPNPLIHRDIKPDNIILTDDGTVKLVDFGAMREFRKNAERDTVYVGTPGYASPEQFGFGQTDTRADIYALGMTLKHMITGEIPERGNTDKIINSNRHLAKIINKAVEFDPDKRYSSVRELKQDLLAVNNPGVYKQPRPNMNQSQNTQNNLGAAREPNMNYSRQKQYQYKNDNRKMYPFYSNIPYIIKILLMPVHALIIAVLVFGTVSVFIYPTGFGFKEDILLFGENIATVLSIAFYYVMGFNLFNINNRWKFFSRNRAIKKAILCIAVFVFFCIILLIFQENHSDAYNLVNSAAG